MSEVGYVPLSEDEERILREIERDYYAHDRRSAERIEQTTLTRYLARNCRWAALGLLVGLVVLIISFAVSWILGLVGFGIMLASAVFLVKNLRRMGSHGLAVLSGTVRERDIAGKMSETRKRLRRRFGEDR